MRCWSSAWGVGGGRSRPGSIAPDHRALAEDETRSPMAIASWSLWVMKMMARPLALRPSRTFWSSAMPCGVSIEVGSSRMSTREPFQSALMISTCCCWPSARLPVRASGSSVTPERAPSSRRGAPGRGLVEDEARGSSPSIRFSSTVSVRDEAEVLVDHADAELDGRAAGESMRTSRPSTRMRAAVGLVEPRQDAHQRRLAGAVLAQQAEHLARASPRRLMRSLATTPGKALVISMSSTAGGRPRSVVASSGCASRRGAG